MRALHTPGHRPEHTAFALVDTDDNMRISQVRALLAGQDWYDLRQYRLSPPFGLDMILVIGSSEPLFDELRPTFEDAADYLADLKRDNVNGDHHRIASWMLKRLIELCGWTRLIARNGRRPTETAQVVSCEGEPLPDAGELPAEAPVDAGQDVVIRGGPLVDRDRLVQRPLLGRDLLVVEDEQPSGEPGDRPAVEVAGPANDVLVERHHQPALAAAVVDTKPKQLGVRRKRVHRGRFSGSRGHAKGRDRRAGQPLFL